MRVTKNKDGQFVVENEPMRLEGEAAEKFLENMRRREETPETEERKKFLDECRRVYEATADKRRY